MRAEEARQLLIEQRFEQGAGRKGLALGKRRLAQHQFPAFVGQIEARGAADAAAESRLRRRPASAATVRSPTCSSSTAAPSMLTRTASSSGQKEHSVSVSAPQSCQRSTPVRPAPPAQIDLQHALARVGDGQHRLAGQQLVGDGAGAGARDGATQSCSMSVLTSVARVKVIARISLISHWPSAEGK